MIRPSTALWLAVVFCVGFVMFKVKYEVQDLEEQVARVNREIVADRDTIHVLKAEWSFLAKPDRIADLARRHLDLAPISTAQLASLDRIETIPMRPPAGEPAAVLAAAPIPLPPGAKPPVPETSPTERATELAQAKTRTLR